jgi:hypothetical protein
MVSDDNATPAVAKIFELFRFRLSGVYGADDGATSEAPVTARADKWTPPLDREHVTLCFQTPAKDHEFWLVLSPVRT